MFSDSAIDFSEVILLCGLINSEESFFFWDSIKLFWSVWDLTAVPVVELVLFTWVDFWVAVAVFLFWLLCVLALILGFCLFGRLIIFWGAFLAYTFVSYSSS